MRGYLIFFILFLLVSPSICFAAEPLSTDDTQTVEKGHWEITFETTYQKQIKKGLNEGTEEFYKEVYYNTNLELALTYGISENWDMGLSFPYVFRNTRLQEDINGFQDFIINTKYRLFNGNKFWPSYALGVDFKTQSANEDKGLGTGQNEFEIINIFSKPIYRLTLHLNLGYNFLTKRKGDDDTFIYGIALDYPLTKEKLNLVGEFRGETNFKNNFDSNPAGILLGFNYAINDRFTFNLGGYSGITEVAPEYEIKSGVTLNF